jgi:phosphate transport system protein
MVSEHTSKQFDNELESVRARVLQMGGLVEHQITQAIQALSDGDVDLADRINAQDHEVNALEVGIDEDCTHIIARRQPAASDLRLIVAIIKTITDLERIGDEAAKIARMAKVVHGTDRLYRPRIIELRHASTIGVLMLRKSLDAFARLDTVSAAQVLRDDQQVDDAFRGILRQLITFMMEDPRTIGPSIEILFAAKALERIGDHAKNIAEYVIYLVKGKDVRHIAVDEVEREVLG